VQNLLESTGSSLAPGAKPAPSPFMQPSAAPEVEPAVAAARAAQPEAADGPVEQLRSWPLLREGEGGKLVSRRLFSLID
jgi:hypothetical protein